MKEATYWFPRAAAEFSVNRNRELKSMQWISLRTTLDREPRLSLISHPNGASYWAIYLDLVCVAANSSPRWHLTDQLGRPHTAESLARLTRNELSLVKETLARLSDLGELAVVRQRRNKIKAVPSHPPAETSHPPAEILSYKREQNKTEDNTTKENETNETARDATKTENPPMNPSDSGGGGSGGEIYASPTDEIKAIFTQKTGEAISIDLLDAIRGDVAAAGRSMEDFLREVRKRRGGTWENPAGLLRHLSKNLRRVSAKARGAVTAAEQAERDYKCTRCGSRKPGEGLLIEAGRFLPCECASPEYIARMRADGTLSSTEGVLQ